MLNAVTPERLDAIDPRRLIGRRLLGGRATWYSFQGGPAEIVHVWLDFEDLPSVRLHTLSGLHLAQVTADRSYEMPEVGGTVTLQEGLPPHFNGLIGETIVEVLAIWDSEHASEVGLRLATARSACSIADLGDDLCMWTDDASQPHVLNVRPLT